MSIRIKEKTKSMATRTKKLIVSQIFKWFDKREFVHGFPESRFYFYAILWITIMNAEAKICTNCNSAPLKCKPMLAQRRHESFSSVTTCFLGYFTCNFYSKLIKGASFIKNDNFLSHQLRNCKVGLRLNQPILNCNEVARAWHKWGLTFSFQGWCSLYFKTREKNFTCLPQGKDISVISC